LSSVIESSAFVDVEARFDINSDASLDQTRSVLFVISIGFVTEGSTDTTGTSSSSIINAARRIMTPRNQSLFERITDHARA
jgi:hypothetical protein